MILNVVVYSVIQPWVSVVVKVEGKYGREVFVSYVHNMAAYFYADGGLLFSKRVAILQYAFQILTGKFDQVALRTKMGKMVGVACQPFSTTGRHSTEAHVLWMAGDGRTIKECVCLHVRCPECKSELVAGSLATHRQVHHEVGRGEAERDPPPPTLHHSPPGYPQTYRISISWVAHGVT